jgi:hypothetical protein
MFTHEMAGLLDAHIQCQLGCYISEVASGPGTSRYVAAAQIPDTGWNFCIPGTGERRDVDWGLDQARLRKRSAAFFVPSANDLNLAQSFDIAPERWMLRRPAPLSASKRPPAITRVEVIETADPGADFAFVFGRLFDDEDINRHFERYYVPTLRAAITPILAKPVHLVAYAGTEPVACASVYLLGELAGLYNVGTVSTRQKSGIGGWISNEALGHVGRRSVFLQCEAGTHVEKLYRSLDFEAVATPEIATVRDADG